MTDNTETTEIELYANAHDTSQVASDKTSEADNNDESSPLSQLLTSINSESTGKKEASRDELWYLFHIYKDYTDFSSYPNKNLAEDNDKMIRNSARKIYIQKLYEAGVTVTRETYIQKLYENGATVTRNNSHVTVRWGNFRTTITENNDGRSAARNAFVSILRKKYCKEWPFPKRPNLNGKPDLQVASHVVAPVGSHVVAPVGSHVVAPVGSHVVAPVGSHVVSHLVLPTSAQKVQCFTSEPIAGSHKNRDLLEAASDSEPKKKVTSGKLKALEAELEQRNKEAKEMQAKLDQRNKEAEVMQAELEQRNKKVEAIQAELEQRNKEEATKAMQLEQRNKEAEALEAELEQRNKKVEAMQAELEQRNKEEAAKAMQLELRKKEVQIEIKTVSDQIEKAKVNKKLEVVPEVEKEISQAELNVISTEIEAIQVELDKYRKAAEARAATLIHIVDDEDDNDDEDEEINAANSLLQLSANITDSTMQKKDISHCQAREKKRISRSEYSDNEPNIDNDDDDDDNDEMFFCQNIEEGLKNGKINNNSYNRLKALDSLLLECKKEGILTIETNNINETCETNMTINTKETKETNNTKEIIMTNETKVITSTKVNKKMLNCVLGWNRLLVSDPLALNKKIHKMIEKDEGGFWKKANGKHNKELKNPTFGVYELLRKIGVKPGLRGPKETDPGKQDMLYHKQWNFKCDESFMNACQRLEKSYSYCPEKGKRDRKRSKKDKKS